MYSFILLFLFCGMCAPTHASHNLTYSTSSQQISLTAHIMQTPESLECFLHNLHMYHICPIQITVDNTTEKTWLISGNSIDELALVPPEIITKDVIFEHNAIATMTAYGCAVAGWMGTLAGFSMVREYLPAFAKSTNYITATVTLCSFIYQAHLFAIHRSTLYKHTHARIMHYGLSSTNVIIDPHTTITKVMFLNHKSYRQPQSPEDTFFYLFTVKLYNLYDMTDVITIPVRIPKIYEYPHN